SSRHSGQCEECPDHRGREHDRMDTWARSAPGGHRHSADHGAKVESAHDDAQHGDVSRPVKNVGDIENQHAQHEEVHHGEAAAETEKRWAGAEIPDTVEKLSPD